MASGAAVYAAPSGRFKGGAAYPSPACFLIWQLTQEGRLTLLPLSVCVIYLITVGFIL